MVATTAEIRILKKLLNADGISLTAIQKACGLNWKDLKKHLANLEKEGLITQHVYTATTIVYLNKNSPKYAAINLLWGNAQ